MKKLPNLNKHDQTGMLLFALAFSFLLLGTGYFFYSTLPIPQEGLHDLNAYLRAGNAVLSGGNPYVPIFPTFQYPPAVAIAFAPLATLDFQSANLVWYWLNLALIVVACAGLVLLVGDARGLAFLTQWVIVLCIAFALLPVWTNAKLGQVSGFTFTLYVYSLVLLKARLPKSGGILLGIVASVKLVPLIFIAHALWKREYRYGLAALGAFVAIQIIPLAIYPDFFHIFWFEKMPTISGNEATVNIALDNLALALSNGMTLFGWFGRGVALIALALPFLLLVKQKGIAAVEVALLCMATNLFGPVVQNHYLVWTLLPGWIALRCLVEMRSVIGLAAMGVMGLLYSQPFRMARAIERFTAFRFPPESLQGGTLLTLGTLIGYIILLTIVLTKRNASHNGPILCAVLAPLSSGDEQTSSLADSASDTPPEYA